LEARVEQAIVNIFDWGRSELLVRLDTP